MLLILITMKLSKREREQHERAKQTKGHSSVQTGGTEKSTNVSDLTFECQLLLPARTREVDR